MQHIIITTHATNDINYILVFFLVYCYINLPDL